jgi:uncharacterized protein
MALPGYTGYMVNDWAYLLTYEEDASLESLCRWVEEETTVEIYVVTTTDLEGYDLNRYSYLLFNDWGIGKEDVNNGLLLICYYEDLNETHFAYEFRIEVGRGLEASITDSEAGRIARDNITLWFELGYFFDGFWDGIDELYDEFEDDPNVRSQEGNPQGLAALRAWGYENPLFAGLIIGAMVSVWSSWLQFSVYRGRQALVPLIAIAATLLFAWWWDGSFMVLLYGIVFAVGGTVMIRGGRRLSGGGRTEGGGYTYY